MNSQFLAGMEDLKKKVTTGGHGDVVHANPYLVSQLALTIDAKKQQGYP